MALPGDVGEELEQIVHDEGVSPRPPQGNNRGFVALFL
jgi:hypothetical protein